MKRIFLALALAFLISPTFARADTIDLFNAPASGVQTSNIAAGGGNPTSSVPNTQTGLANVFGGRRTIETTRTAGTGGVTMNVNTSSASHLVIEMGVATSGTSTSLYDYLASGFTANFTNAVSLIVENIDQDVGSSTFSFTFNGGAFTTPGQVLVGAQVDTDLTFLLAGVPAGILANVTSLQLNIVSGPDTDLAVDNITTGGPITLQEIPEPGSLAVCALVALSGMVYVRRRRRVA